MPAKQHAPLTQAPEAVETAPETEATRSNSQQLDALGLATAGGFAATALIDVLGPDLPRELLEQLPTDQLVELFLAGCPLATPVLALLSMDRIAAACPPEQAARLVDRVLAVGHGVALDSQVKGFVKGLAGSARGEFLRDGDQSAVLSLSREGEISAAKESAETPSLNGVLAAEASLAAKVLISQEVVSEIELDARELLRCFGTGAAFMTGLPTTALQELAHLLVDRIPAPEGREETLSLTTEAKADASATQGELAEEPRTLFQRTDEVLAFLADPSLLASLDLATEAGLKDVLSWNGPELCRTLTASAEVDGSVGAPLGLPGLDDLVQRLRGFGAGAEVTWELRYAGGEGLLQEIRLAGSCELARSEETRELVFDSVDAVLAFLDPTDAGEAATLGDALEASGLVSIQRSVSAALPRSEEEDFAPGLYRQLSDHLARDGQALTKTTELSIEASCRVRAEPLIELLREVPCPGREPASVVARQTLEALLDFTRGQDLPPWLQHHLPHGYLDAIRLEAPRVVGKVAVRHQSATARTDVDLPEVETELEQVVDLPYTGDLELWGLLR